MQHCPDIANSCPACTTMVATTVEDMLPQFELIKQLNPELTHEQYQAQLPIMVTKGYRQLVCKNDDTNLSIGVCGFWELSKFWCGNHIEMDNFVVDHTVRGQGLGKIMMQHIEDFARSKNYAAIKLDTYHHATEAQAFYKKHGYESPGIVMKKSLL